MDADQERHNLDSFHSMALDMEFAVNTSKEAPQAHKIRAQRHTAQWERDMPVDYHMERAEGCCGYPRQTVPQAHTSRGMSLRPEQAQVRSMKRESKMARMVRKLSVKEA